MSSIEDQRGTTEVASPRTRDTGILGPIDLIDLIYGSIIAPALWPVWTGRLADTLGGRIRLHEPGLGGSGLNNAFEALVGDHEGPAPNIASPCARWVTSAELASQGRARPVADAGFAHALSLQATLGGQPCTVLSLHRRISSGELDAPQWALLRRLGPHLARAVYLRALLARASAAGRAAALALDVAHIGMFVVDGDRRVDLASKFVVRACQSGPLSWKAGLLDTIDANSTDILQQAIAAAARSARPRASTFSIEGGGARYNLVVSPIPPASGLDELERRALVLLSPSRSVTREDLRREYGLTPSEAALLCALINGQRLADYAAASRLQLSTVKTHLRGVFMKTGEQRQADLIRRVLSDLMLRDPGARA
jgi:DNA-binding CsgD family transcriptional regulator